MKKKNILVRIKKLLFWMLSSTWLVSLGYSTINSLTFFLDRPQIPFFFIWNATLYGSQSLTRKFFQNKKWFSSIKNCFPVSYMQAIFSWFVIPSFFYYSFVIINVLICIKNQFCIQVYSALFKKQGNIN